MSDEALRIELTIDDPEVLAWLGEFEEGDRPAKAATALRIGVLALRQASGFIDRQAIKDEGKQLTSDIERHVNEAMNTMVGPESSLMKTLDPKHADGLIAQLQEAVEEDLAAQGGKVLAAFSLDDESSPLSRLVTYVQRSQDSVRSEFSLDVEGSALSRLLTQLKVTLTEHEKVNAEFREQVTGALQEMAVRKQVEARGTLHGLEFEDAVVRYLESHAAGVGDIAESTGATTGVIKNCKIGDCVLELGPDNASGGEKIVFEAKEDASYTLSTALEEIDKGRRNRQAQVGVFVWSARCASSGTERLRRYGRDIIVVWDSEDSSSDVWLDAAIMLAKGLALEGSAPQYRRLSSTSTPSSGRLSRSPSEPRGPIRSAPGGRPWRTLAATSSRRWRRPRRTSSDRSRRCATMSRTQSTPSPRTRARARVRCVLRGCLGVASVCRGHSSQVRRRHADYMTV